MNPTKKRTTEGIRTALDLSTGHIRLETNNLLMTGEEQEAFRFVNSQYGFVIFLCDKEGHRERKAAGNYDRFPELIPIIEYALKNDCLLINFDRDAESITGLKSFDW